jgi:chitin deacetylase
MKKNIIGIPLLVVFIGVLAYALFLLTKSRTFQFFGGLTDRIQTDKKIVALTFDDAPSNQSGTVLSIVNEKNIHATFYMIGKNIETFPHETKLIADQGHEIGNHSYSHERIVLKPYSFIDAEIQKTNTLIRNAGYMDEITFRPPNGKKLFLLPWYLSAHQMKTIMWDVEPDTFVPGDTQAITDYVLAHVRSGSIILMHPFCEKACESDRDALPYVIDGLKAKGYTFVTVSELLKYRK